MASHRKVRTYDGHGALASYAATYNSSPLFSTGYTRDSLGRITEIAETIQGTSSTAAFTYDSAGRLFEVRRNGVLTATYLYDLNGNRTSLTTPSGMVSATTDAQDRLTAYGNTSFQYTANGELRARIDGADTTRYTYDALGNLVMVALPTGDTISYVLDAANRRIGRRLNGTLTQGWLYQSQLAPVAELDGSGAVVSRFVYATHVNVPDYLVKGGARPTGWCWTTWGASAWWSTPVTARWPSGWITTSTARSPRTRAPASSPSATPALMTGALIRITLDSESEHGYGNSAAWSRLRRDVDAARS